ncbi:hypothetical protein RN001_009482 [Aquatica leii]|uniref:Odorant receptor n=1 Tax=Aquatica leii TaxID=1421715 RepID=A0AAN7S865_9COLE|nr:hypothetical protein RN001_009482 [Aquatica leii]
MLVFLAHEHSYFDAHDALNSLMKTFKSHTYSARVEFVSTRISTLYIVFLYSALVHYSVVPLIDYNNCQKRDNSDSALTCGLPNPASFPLNTTKNPGYMFIYIFHVISDFLCVQSVLHPLLISGSIIYHIIGHLYMIQDDLTSLFEQSINKKDKLKQIIRHHAEVIEVCNLIYKGLNQMLLMYTVMLAIIFSVCGFQVLNMFSTKIEFWIIQRYITIFFGYALICWMLSFLGQKLIDESTQVSACAYNVEWYTESLEFQQMIRLVILRANKPLVVRSAFITNVCFASFTTVARTTYSYLTMMYNMMIINKNK